MREEKAPTESGRRMQRSSCFRKFLARGEVPEGVGGQALLAGPLANLSLGVAALALLSARIQTHAGRDFLAGYLAVLAFFQLMAACSSLSDIERYRSDKKLYNTAA